MGVPLSYKYQCQTHEKVLYPNEERDSTRTMVLLSSPSSEQGSWRDAAAAVKSFQSCPTLCNPIDGSPPGPSVHGILQARTLEWVAISFSNACMHAKSLQSCPTLCDPMDSSPPGSSVHGILQARILEWVAISFSSCKNIPLNAIEIREQTLWFQYL